MDKRAEDAAATSTPRLTARLLRSMSTGQHDILDLLLENNGICHIERLKQRVQGWREPHVSIKGLQHRGLVTVDMEVGDWGCPSIHYVRLTPQGRQIAQNLHA